MDEGRRPVRLQPSSSAARRAGSLARHELHPKRPVLPLEFDQLLHGEGPDRLVHTELDDRLPLLRERLLKLALPVTYVWLCGFYVFFHLWLNLLALSVITSCTFVSSC